MNSSTLTFAQQIPAEELEQTQVQCEVCLKEVPASETKSAEGRDYVLYFCGTDCYHQWEAGEKKSEG